MYTPAPAARHFIVHTTPTVADPAWMAAVTEIFPDHSCRIYSSVTELRELLNEVERKQIERGAAQLEFAKVLTDLHMTFAEYHAFVAERRKNASNKDEAVSKPQMSAVAEQVVLLDQHSGEGDSVLQPGLSGSSRGESYPDGYKEEVTEEK